MRRTVSTLAVVSALILTGCGSSNSPAGTGSSGSSAGAPSASPAPAAIRQAVSRAYEAVFGSSSTLAQSVAALQHGPVFRQTLISESKQPDAKGSGARVTAVSLSGPDVAVVQFTVISNHKPVFPTAGKAVRTGDRWQVAAQTFCALLGLAGQAPRACADPKITALPG